MQDNFVCIGIMQNGEVFTPTLHYVDNNVINNLSIRMYIHVDVYSPDMAPKTLINFNIGLPRSLKQKSLILHESNTSEIILK